MKDEDVPKSYILQMEYDSVEKKAMMVVKRENWVRKGDNGIGLQMLGFDNIPPLGQDHLSLN